MDTKLYEIRKQFPALSQKVNDHRLCYLDSAATTLKPKSVIDRVVQFNSYEASNVHRGAHFLSDQATKFYEAAREKVAQFLNAKSSEEIVFVRGTTEAINLVANSFSQIALSEGDSILITEMEHHANIVPWHILAEKMKLNVKAVRIQDNGELDLEDLKLKLKNRPKLLAVSACSNTLGTINPIIEIVKLAKEHGVKVLVDGAQIVSLERIDLQEIDCDFFAFSGHKIFSTFGTGVLYAKKEILEKMPPYQGGGSMIHQVTIEKSTFNDIPFRFEAGTPAIDGPIALHSALEFVEEIGFSMIHNWENELLRYATDKLSSIDGLKIFGTAKNKAPIISFNIDGIHSADLAQILDQQGIAIRAGHHCTHPLWSRYKVSGTARASFSIYNTTEDIDQLFSGILKAKELLT